MGSWKTCLVLVTLCQLVVSIEKLSDKIKENVNDETLISNPRSFDYNFDDDTRKPADTNDIYDELVPFLPRFIEHKNGRDGAYTRIPIVTRKVPTWSTPAPVRQDPYKDWTVPILLVTRFPFTWPSSRFRNTTPRPVARSFGVPKDPQKFAGKARSRVEIPIGADSHEERVQNLHFSKFAQRFGVNRVIPQTAQPATTATITATTTPSTVAPTTLRQFTRRALFHDRLPVSGSASRSIIPRPVPKPPVIHPGTGPYRGPTYNCRVLSPNQDGRPSARNDPSCAMAMPGFSSDGRCRCTYGVDDRDENGCATGYLYTCLPK